MTDVADDPYKALKQDMARLCNTDYGRNVMRHIRNICGAHLSTLVVNPVTHEANPYSTIAEASRRNVYLELRALFPHSQMAAIEIDPPQKEGV